MSLTKTFWSPGRLSKYNCSQSVDAMVIDHILVGIPLLSSHRESEGRAGVPRTHQRGVTVIRNGRSGRPRLRLPFPHRLCWWMNRELERSSPAFTSKSSRGAITDVVTAAWAAKWSTRSTSWCLRNSCANPSASRMSRRTNSRIWPEPLQVLLHAHAAKVVRHHHKPAAAQVAAPGI